MYIPGLGGWYEVAIQLPQTLFKGGDCHYASFKAVSHDGSSAYFRKFGGYLIWGPCNKDPTI